MRPLLILPALLVGCAMPAPSEAPHPTAPYIPPDDAAFVDVVLPRHDVAVQLAALEIERGRDAEVVELARLVYDNHVAEIERLEAARAAFDAPAADVPADEHAALDLAAMEAASGEDADVIFLADMLPHHAETLALAHRARPNLTHPDLQALAATMEEDRARGIAQMRDLLDDRAAWNE